MRSAKSLKVRVPIFEFFYKAYILKKLSSHTYNMSNTYISSSSKLKTMYLFVLLSIKEKFNWSLIIYFDNWTKQKSSTWMRKVLKLLKQFWYIYHYLESFNPNLTWIWNKALIKKIFNKLFFVTQCGKTTISLQHKFFRQIDLEKVT